MKKLSALILSVVLTLSAAALSVGAAEPNQSLPVTDGNVYKNLYSVSSDAAIEDENATPADFDKLTGNIDSKSTAYLTFAVYTPKAGEYSFKLAFTGAEYAAVKAGGAVIKAVPDTAFKLELSKGLNLITCFGATAEQDGAKITYTALLCENGLNPIEGEYYIGGDVNNDKSVDIIDLVRYKKYLAKTAEVKVSAADLNKDGTVDTGDMTMLKKYILGIEGIDNAGALDYEIGYVMRDNDISDNWNY
mgnify:FL=1